jgi:hypothetical protein
MPLSCEGLAPQCSWVRLKCTLCVGGERTQAVETQWSSRVYARLGSREGCNVVGGKFNPEWPCGEMLLFSRVVLGAARARLLVEVMATTLYLYAAD